MVNITDKSKCCGCNACGDVCIHQAIKFHIDVEGFWYPEVDKDKCTDCGLCEKVCPIINKEDWHESGGFEKPHCYALINKNIEVRFDSTSGGAFSALADEIYKKSGYVGGAIYNEDWSVSQFLSSSREDLSRLRSSKYLQSHLDGFYIAVREALKTGKPVLVCGSPCQMAAMKRFLRKPYENLMVVDYICRGIASPLYFKQFINYLEQKHHSTVVYYKAKSKELGWRTLSTRVEFANKDVDYILGKENPWLSMQYKIPEVCRPSCFDCPFKGFPRTSDLTIGDLWSSPGSIPKELDSDIGTSVVFANNEKGADMLNKCKKKIIWSDFSFEEATKGNYHLMYSLKHSEHNREDFFKTLNISFQACIDKYMPDFGQTQKSLKEKIKNVACFIKGVTGAAGWNIGTWIKNMRYNLFCRQIETRHGKWQPFFLSSKRQIITVMKQTVSIFAPDINVASKSSAIQLWLNRKNQFFSSVLEEDVSNRQVLLLGHASFVFSALICASFVSQVPALICLAWFMVALRLCVKGGLG